MVVGIHVPTEIDLAQVAEAKSRLTFRFGLAQSGQKHQCQDRDDRDHHQELDQREGGLAARAPGSRSVAYFEWEQCQHALRSNWMPASSYRKQCLIHTLLM